jgi:hypothetical protein
MLPPSDWVPAPIAMLSIASPAKDREQIISRASDTTMAALTPFGPQGFPRNACVHNVLRPTTAYVQFEVYVAPDDHRQMRGLDR